MSKPRKSILKQQVFAFKAPDAQSVQLAGDFTDWERNPITMLKDSDGTWRAKVQLQPGTYHYRFLVDGQWQDDPECPQRAANPFGTDNMVRQVA